MIVYDDEALRDVAARENLLDSTFGPARWRKSSERIRCGRLPADGLSLVARDRDAVAGTVRLWHITAGRNRPTLLLGPLAVDGRYRGAGIGAALMRLAIARARDAGHAAVILVGDPQYYARFGFSAERTAGLAMPGPYERHRLLALELVPGALDGAAGVILPTGKRIARGAAEPLLSSALAA